MSFNPGSFVNSNFTVKSTSQNTPIDFPVVSNPKKIDRDSAYGYFYLPVVSKTTKKRPRELKYFYSYCAICFVLACFSVVYSCFALVVFIVLAEFVFIFVFVFVFVTVQYSAVYIAAVT